MIAKKAKTHLYNDISKQNQFADDVRLVFNSALMAKCNPTSPVSVAAKELCVFFEARSGVKSPEHFPAVMEKFPASSECGVNSHTGHIDTTPGWCSGCLNFQRLGLGLGRHSSHPKPGPTPKLSNWGECMGCYGGCCGRARPRAWASGGGSRALQVGNNMNLKG